MIKIKTILIKYKSHIVTAFILAIIFYALGHTVAFNEDISWVYQNKDNTEKLIKHSSESYTLQQKISLNYEQSYNGLLDCFSKGKDNCSLEELLNNQKQLVSERESMITELNKINSETENLLKAMGY